MRDYGLQSFNSNSSFQKSKLSSKSSKKYLVWISLIIVLVLLLKLAGKNSDKTKDKTQPELNQQEFAQKTADFKFINPISIFEKEPEPVEANITQELLIQDIKNLVSGKQGDYAFYVQSLKTGEAYGYNYDHSYTAASINKIPIVLAFLEKVEQGEFSLDEVYSLKSIDKEEGTGGLQYQRNGTKYTYRELILETGQHSDNTAANALSRILGENAVQSFVLNMGINNIEIEKNKTTAKEMVELLTQVYLGKILNKEEHKTLFFDSLTDTEFEARIPAGVPGNIRVAHKIGNQIQVWSDCGIVFSDNPYALCLLTEGIRESEAQEILPLMSRKIWQFESQRE